MNPDAAQNVLHQQARLTTATFLENVQDDNFESSEQEFLWPEKPWKTMAQYQGKKEEYEKEFQKAQILSEYVNEKEELMIKARIRNEEEGAIVEEDEESREEITIGEDNNCSNETANRTIFQVTKLPEYTKEEDLSDLLKPFGRVSEIYLAQDTANDTLNKFAIITFDNRKEAEKAMEYLCQINHEILLLDDKSTQFNS